MIRPQPSTRTNSRILNGREIITGGSIIMPIDISAAETTMSITRNGMKITKPMMNAARSSEIMNAGISVGSGTAAGVGRVVRPGGPGHQGDVLLAGVGQHEVAAAARTPASRAPLKSMCPFR